MPSIFNDFFGDDFMSLTPAKQFATPAVNITENEKNYEIEVAAPGLTKDDIKVNVDNGNELAISYEKKEEQKNDKKNFLRHEFAYTSFHQSFVLPDEVKVEGIDAQMVNGVLKVTLPKKESVVTAAASRQISIK